MVIKTLMKQIKQYKKDSFLTSYFGDFDSFVNGKNY